MRNEITHICICGSAYALLQYLLLQKEEVCRDHTFYFVGSGVSPLITRNLVNCERFETMPVKGVHRIKRVFIKLYLRCFGRRLYPFVKSSDIYAQDYLYPIVIIGRYPYKLLNESPYFFSVNYSVKSTEYMRCMAHLHSLSGKIETMLYGKPLVFLPGQTNQCEEILLTEPNKTPLLAEKKYKVDTLKSLWEQSEESKKEYILSVFNASRNDLIEKKCIFLTQPIVQDGLLTEEEYEEVLKKVLSLYEKKQICIKVHPRDDFNYGRLFPEVEIYAKPINLELLLMINQKCDRVISLFSTAVNTIPEEIDVDWYGTSVHPKLFHRLGNTVVPFRRYNQKSIKEKYI